MRERNRTLSDIAKLAGVSKSTASRALAGSDLVKEDTRERVLEIAREYNFRPNAMARAVATQRSGLIGFCLYQKTPPFFAHTFFGPILDGLAVEARKQGFHVVLAATDSEQDRFEEQFIEDAIDGAVLVSNYPASMAPVFRERGIPIVIINDTLPLKHTGYIIDDNYGGARQVMDYLIGIKKAKRIAFVSHRLSHPSYLSRYLGYLDALKDAGLEPFSAPYIPKFDLMGDVQEYNTSITAAHGYDGIPASGSPIILSDVSTAAAFGETMDLIRPDDLPDAYFCATDSIAFGVINALRSKGIRVPEDAAVTGYDDIPDAAAFRPALTTVRVDMAGIGRSAMELLRTYITDPSLPSRTVVLKNKLIVRESA